MNIQSASQCNKLLINKLENVRMIKRSTKISEIIQQNRKQFFESYQYQTLDYQITMEFLKTNIELYNNERTPTYLDNIIRLTSQNQKLISTMVQSFKLALCAIAWNNIHNQQGIHLICNISQFESVRQILLRQNIIDAMVQIIGQNCQNKTLINQHLWAFVILTCDLISSQNCLTLPNCYAYLIKNGYLALVKELFWNICDFDCLLPDLNTYLMFIAKQKNNEKSLHVLLTIIQHSEATQINKTLDHIIKLFEVSDKNNLVMHSFIKIFISLLNLLGIPFAELLCESSILKYMITRFSLTISPLRLALLGLIQNFIREANQKLIGYLFGLQIENILIDEGLNSQQIDIVVQSLQTIEYLWIKASHIDLYKECMIRFSNNSHFNYLIQQYCYHPNISVLTVATRLKQLTKLDPIDIE